MGPAGWTFFKLGKVCSSMEFAIVYEYYICGMVWMWILFIYLFIEWRVWIYFVQLTPYTVVEMAFLYIIVVVYNLFI